MTDQGSDGLQKAELTEPPMGLVDTHDAIQAAGLDYESHRLDTGPQSGVPEHDDEPEDEPSFRLADEDVPAALEALLFASGDPVSLDKLQQITGVERHALQEILTNLVNRYTRDRQRGLMLREIDGSYLLATKPEQKTVLQRLFQPRHRPPLSQAAYETLAIIAYNQPVTRAQVESVRGVNSDNIIARLIERNLVEETGSLDAPGRPLLFSTTNQFLLDFGLRSVKDLPPMELLMYGTLRDFEESLEEASGRQRDKQITIDQLVQAFVPGFEKTVSVDSGTNPEGQPVMSDETVWQLSEALFGEETEMDPDDPDDKI